ncbi:rod-binding protein [Jiella avicenniae]|uniref:Rod-binding protein n=1 Tax=Jiella avicenniae TaxID=2907202 RepID=A0A9X1T9M1_9HYPH|nr:rod-binding protein [Jiella avicenniae]MCE7026458.1 rod-binding protein [Jiella avicenniae]
MTISNDFSINPAALAATKAEAVGRTARPTATPAAGEGFAAALATAGETSRTAAGTGNSAQSTIRPLVKHEARDVPPLEQFEGFVLRSFVESMLPSGESEFFGKGTAGDIWRSMLAEEIGNEMAKGGGIGIADTIAKKGGAPAEGRASAVLGDGTAKLHAENDAALAATHRIARHGG